jgi:hypothetical protein
MSPSSSTSPHPKKASYCTRTRRCRKATCERCGPIWAGDQSRVLREGIRLAGEVSLVTVTAPSMSGSRLAGARIWNATAPRRMQRFHQKCQQHAKRKHGVHSVVAGVWEVKGNRLHRHLLLPWNTEAERASSKTYFAKLKELSGTHGFGFVHKVPKPMPGLIAAGYLSKDLLLTARHEAAPSRIVHVSRALTSRSGVTMRSIRKQRWIWVVQQRYGLSDEEAPLWAEALARSPWSSPSTSLVTPREHGKGSFSWPPSKTHALPHVTRDEHPPRRTAKPSWAPAHHQGRRRSSLPLGVLGLSPSGTGRTYEAPHRRRDPDLLRGRGPPHRQRFHVRDRPH